MLVASLSRFDPKETPAVEAALISESAIWMSASLATIPAFTAVERSGTASVGVILRKQLKDKAPRRSPIG